MPKVNSHRSRASRATKRRTASASSARPGDQGILFHHRRQLADGQILFLVNTSIEHPSSGVVLSSLRGAESWNLYTGEIKPFPFARLGAGISAKFDLPPSGSLLLFLSQKPVEGRVPARDRRHACRRRPGEDRAASNRTC